MKVIALDYYADSPQSISTFVKELVPYTEFHSFFVPGELLAHLKENGADIAFLDISRWTAPGMHFISEVQAIVPRINVVVVTDNSKIASSLFAYRISGLILKPFKKEDFSTELKNLRYPILEMALAETKVEIRNGNEVFFQGKPVGFSLEKAKDLFLFLVSKGGSLESNEEIINAIFPGKEANKSTQSMLRTTFHMMNKSFAEAGVTNLFMKRRGYLAVLMNRVAHIS